MQWQKNMLLIDANVILRGILNDHPEMTQKAKEVISTSENMLLPMPRRKPGFLVLILFNIFCVLCSLCLLLY